MPIQTMVTFSSDAEVVQIPGEEGELLEVLGGESYAMALQLQDMLTAVQEAVAGSLTEEGELEIEITGSLELKASGEVKYLFFNVGGETSKTNTMTVTLKTKIRPVA